MEGITHWIAQYGYVGLFSLLVLGIVGIPLPDEMLLTLMGYLVYKGEMSGPAVLGTVLAGSMCGITLSYLLGRSLGHWLIVRYGMWVRITPARLDMVHDWFARYGKWTLTLGYYLPGIRHVTAYTAGMTEMRYKTFALFAYSGALLWTCTFVLLGYVLGPSWRRVREWLPAERGIGFGLVAVAVVLYVVLLRLRRRRRQMEQAAMVE